MVRLKDIALQASVSSATVSRILNKDDSLAVTDETREKVLRIADELGYQPSAKKRKNRSRSDSAPLIGVISCLSPEEERQDPYFSAIRKGIEEECFRQKVFITSSIHLGSFQENMFHELDGVIVIGSLQDEALTNISAAFRHAVFVNGTPDPARYDTVSVDFYAAAQKAIEHLLSLGYQRLGYIGGREREHTVIDGVNSNKTIEDKRLTAFLQMAGAEPEHVLIGEYSMHEGFRLMNEAIKGGSLPDAFFIASDSMAVGALKALQEAGLQVPRDTAVVSFNGIDEAEYASTPLSTVKVYTEEMGRTGVKLLLDRLNGRTVPLAVTLPTSLIVRQSCGSQERR
ncbi:MULTISPECIES: LacI family DNA-binding transcriptional regulator [Bacillus]|uniref:LacI family DNA-binding transcriptional regulator n=1 Tax=Bacillus TaxID=1386 RepID=UPI000BA3E085|nr:MULTISPECIES: LacI family DNA-binding transcriptional regulator [Bacillus]MBY0033968.1 LacI family DNA-binding transcriptional regulator [Bacillus velezensis]MBY0043182.1 LacI family DNA-binding transcriptional regulator [Bacillus velezensis]MCY1637536.1 LacI family DNA-binding transcriptional regulator [Bacillus sp. SL112]PAB03058.1 LacI family transcriptional regulator [Bacillus velezensis]